MRYCTIRKLAAAFCVIIIFNLCGCTMQEEELVYESNKAHISCAWWGNDSRNDYMVDGIDYFRTLYPDITVDCKYGIWGGYPNRQKIYMKSHDEPDVMLINYNWIDEYSKDGEGFYDLYQLADYIDLSNFSQEALSYGEVNGKLNAIPIALNSQVIYYNQDIFDEYGLELPKTWEDFFTAAQVMRNDGLYVLTANEKSLFLLLISYYEQTTGKPSCDEDGNLIIQKDGIEYMLKFYKRLIDEKVMMPIEKSTSKSFFEERAAGIMRWASGAQEYFKTTVQKGINVAVGEYPQAENASDLGWYIKPATMYAISKGTVYPKESAQLLEYLLNSEHMNSLQKNEKGFPLSESARKVLEKQQLIDPIEDAANQMIVQNQKDMKLMPAIFEDDSKNVGFRMNADFYLYGEDTLENVVDRIYNDLYK